MSRDTSRGAPRRRGVATRKPTHVTVPVSFLLRVGILAGAGLAGSVWALVRYYTHPPVPMRVTVAIDAGEWDAGAGLIQAPELETLPSH